MDPNVKNRLVGVIVICALAVIFLPMILDGSGMSRNRPEVVIPPQPLVSANPEFEPKLIELQSRVDELPQLEARHIDENSPEVQSKATASGTGDDTEKLVKASPPAEKTPAPVVDEAPQSPPGGDSWVLQVGSFQDRDKALAQRDKLRKSNIAAVFIEQFEYQNKPSYRVRLGPFLNRDQTRVAQNKIKAKYDIDGIIMKYERYSALFDSRPKHELLPSTTTMLSAASHRRGAPMSWLDIVIIVIIVLSALISVVRGFVKETISLITWVVAGILAFRYFAPLAEVLEPWVESSTIRSIVAFGFLFVSTLVIGAIINFIMSQLVDRTGLSGTDKALGVLFGAARGVLIVTMIVLLASLTPMPEASWWQDSAMMGFFQQLAAWLKGIIPADAAESFRF